MARASVSARAAIDYDEIVEYAARDKPVAALRLSERIRAKIDLLAQVPGSGVGRPDLGPDVRSATLGRYVIYYRPSAEGIDVIRILSGDRDVDSLG